MNPWNDTALRATLLACSLLAAARCATAHADEKRPGPKPYGSGSPAASVSAMPVEPAVALVDGHRPWVPTLDVVVPQTASAPPTKEEWVKAPVAMEVRMTNPGCKAQRIREWYRISCGFGLLEMIAGARDGVTFSCPRAQVESDLCDDAAVVFPARRGDSRAFQFLGWSKWGPDPDAVLTEQFLEGDPVPLISMQGVHWGF